MIILIGDNDTKYQDGFVRHCEIAADLLLKYGTDDAHSNELIRTAIREASYKVTPYRGKGKNTATMISKRAEKQVLNRNRKDLTLEHCVPVSVITKFIYDEYKNNKTITCEKIQQIVLDWTLLVVVTKEDDAALKQNGLTKTMPKDWDGEDKYARYKVAGIECIDKPYKELIKEAA